MTNKEKYAEDLYSIFLRSFGVDEENKPFRCSEKTCGRQCQFYHSEIDCKTLAKQWLDEEYKTDWSKVPVDTPILVKDSESESVKWKHRYFAKYENGKVFTWADGVTSWSIENANFVSEWRYARLCEDNK